MSFWKRLFGGKSEDESGSPSSAPTPPPPTPASSGGCDHGAIELRANTAAFEEFVARGELESGRDLAHGARHLAELLAFDPSRAHSSALLERYLEALKPAGLDAAMPTDRRYYAFEALRAFAWHRDGRLAQAVALLTEVVNAKPDASYLEAWGLPWLEADGAMEALDAPTAMGVLGVTLNRFPEARLATPRTLRRTKRWAALSERWFARNEEPAAGEMLRIGLLRKAGELDRAESLARAAVDREPTWHVASALGLVLREKGQARRSSEAFELALRLDPSDVSGCLENGDTFVRAGDWASALTWYERALAKQPGDWAQASAAYCRAKLAGDRAMGELQLFANAGNRRAAELLYYEAGGDAYTPYDALANILRQLCAEPPAPPKPDAPDVLKITLSALEAPSNVIAIRTELQAQGRNPTIAITVSDVQSPDPRLPLEPAPHCLWSYDGTDPSPSFPPPAEAVSTAIARIASLPAGREDRANAGRVAEELGPSRVRDILAVMVHPPPMPAGRSALEWIPRVQRLCASVLGEVDEGWMGSVRREALTSVLLGPRDWATIAAIRELGAIGRSEPIHAPDIGEAFAKLAEAVTDFGDCPWAAPLYDDWSTLPHLFPHERKELEARLEALRSAS